MSEIKQRGTIRKSFTKTGNKIDVILNKIEKTEEDINELTSLLKFLNVRHNELREKDDIILTGLQSQNPINEKDIDKEQEKIDEYYIKYLNYETAINKLIDLSNKNNDEDKISNRSSSTTAKCKYKLPVLHLKKFGGDLGDWLPFWAQFEKLDEDENMADVDKLGYLSQSMIEGSIAKQLIDSYPATGNMYKVVVNALKTRFGRRDLLTEFYIRELLKLVIQNTNSSDQLPITTLYDKIQSHLRHLETLNVTSDNYAPILMPLVSSSLPEDLLMLWERGSARLVRGTNAEATSKEMLVDLLSFLQSEVEGLQKMELAKRGFSDYGDAVSSRRTHKKGTKSENVPTAIGLLTGSDHRNSSCVFCTNNHNSQDCKKALKLSLQERRNIVSEKKCCYCCLTPGHQAKTCKKRPKCALCGKSHFVIMCYNQKKENGSEQFSNPSNIPAGPKFTHQETLTNTDTRTSVLMQTLVVILRRGNICRRARLLIDSASHRSYILSKTLAEMRYTPQGQEEIMHSVFGGTTTGVVKHNVYKIFLSNLDGSYHCNFDALDQQKICGNIESVPDGPWIKELASHNIKLCDTGSNVDIDILVGADVAARLWTGKRVVLSSGLVAMETFFGWTLSGKIPQESLKVKRTLVSTVISLLSKEATISDLWTLDTLGILDPTNKQSKVEIEAATQQHFLDTVNVNVEGRFEVHLPWVQDHPPLPNNYEMSLKRLQTTIKRLKDEKHYGSYQNVLNEWLNEEVIEEVPQHEIDLPCHYLPHRHVIKPNSTTPVRPVFDASAKLPKQPSLNQCLSKGPNLLEKIPSILSRFRLKKVGVIGDIRRAFLQIGICKSDRNYLRFLWIDKDGNLKIYRHCRVVFGVSSSPFLLESCIALHLKETESTARQGEDWPSDLIQMLQNSFYVDNCMTSLEDQEKAQQFVKMASDIMMRRKFELRGWEVSGLCDSSRPTNVLGLLWDKDEDTLSINTESVSSISLEPITKRTILSAAHRVFDPIGVSCSVTLIPKILLQETWEKGIPWDETLTGEIEAKFLKWMDELPLLGEVKIPRWVSNDNTPDDKWTIHVFSDASKTSYAAAVFLRVELDDRVHVQLLAARAKVAPTTKTNKRMTIPRLELLAATIAARLHSTVKNDFMLPDVKTIFWTDATTVLAWIRREEPWDLFVMNRVKEIRNLTNGSPWRHVPGNKNPADLPSRGSSVKKLLESRWWEGPTWLKENSDHWPQSEMSFDEEEINEERKRTIMSSTMCDFENKEWFYNYFSQYKKLVRMIGWIYRFKNNAKNGPRHQGNLTAEEYKNAEKKVIQLVQEEAFADVCDPRLKTLLPFIDKKGLIRLTTKISNRQDTNDFCHPVVLPSAEHPVVHRLILDLHRDNCHAGTQILLSLLRQRYWILGGRRTIRKVLNSCVRCKRHTARNLVAEPTPLPEARVRDAKVFEVTGVDLAGPLFIRSDDGHSMKKTWICLFTCGVYRAVRLELISSLSTDSFIQALRRFCSRQGRPRIMYSDHGTNVGFYLLDREQKQ